MMEAKVEGYRIILSERPVKSGGIILVSTSRGDRRLEIHEDQTGYDLPSQVTPEMVTALTVLDGEAVDQAISEELKESETSDETVTQTSPAEEGAEVSDSVGTKVTGEAEQKADDQVV